jgi:hypothetical protein
MYAVDSVSESGNDRDSISVRQQQQVRHTANQRLRCSVRTTHSTRRAVSPVVACVVGMTLTSVGALKRQCRVVLAVCGAVLLVNGAA